MRVLIAERHALPRAAIAELVKAGLPDSEVFQIRDLTEAGPLLDLADVTVCMTDIGLLESHDLRELTTLRSGFPALKLLVRLDEPRRDVILACFRAGAHGCITEETSAADVVSAISCVTSGAVAVPAAIADLTKQGTSGRWAGSADNEKPFLTGRQNDVLCLLAEGRSTKDIARCLNLSVGTVNVHLGSVFRALGARNRVEAAIRATEGQPRINAAKK